MYILYIVEMRYEATDTGNFKAKGQDEILAIYSVGVKLSEFQPHCQQ